MIHQQVEHIVVAQSDIIWSGAIVMHAILNVILVMVQIIMNAYNAIKYKGL
jgi:hypothetical protein